MNVEEWKKEMERRMGEKGEETVVRSMPAFEYEIKDGRLTQLFPVYLLEELKSEFPLCAIMDTEHLLTEERSRSSETVYSTVQLDGIEFVSRLMINHTESLMTFNYTIDHIDPTPQHEDTMFHIFSLTKDYVEKWSPNRLFLSTSTYRDSFPALIKNKMKSRH